MPTAGYVGVRQFVNSGVLTLSRGEHKLSPIPPLRPTLAIDITSPRPKMRKFLLALLSVLTFTTMLTAQSGGSAPPAAAAQAEAGFTSVIQFGGSVNSSGQVFKLDSNVGYDFNRHW